LTEATGAAFFVGDAEATTARWRLVLAWLQVLERAGARSEEIVSAAYSTFLTLGRWVREQGASRRPEDRQEEQTSWST
jgi:heme oxygenase